MHKNTILNKLDYNMDEAASYIRIWRAVIKQAKIDSEQKLPNGHNFRKVRKYKKDALKWLEDKDDDFKTVLELAFLNQKDIDKL